MRFEHDGAAFSSQELAALLSGGSSKELDSEHTTGRFGTGFLVTHVLAEETRVVGLLRVKGGYELPAPRKVAAVSGASGMDLTISPSRSTGPFRNQFMYP